MSRSEVPALSVAIARHGQFVYRKAFRMGGTVPVGAGRTKGSERATPSNLFRIASVSKPITSVTIFTLIEKGRLKLDDFVFGPNGALGSDYGSSYPDRVEKTRVEHLLTHTCGGWSNDADDPMFIDKDLSQAELIKWTRQASRELGSSCSPIDAR